MVSSDVRNRLSKDLLAMPLHSLVLHTMRDVTASAMYRLRGILPWRHTVHVKVCSALLWQDSRKLVAQACGYATTRRWCGLSGSCNWCISSFLRVLTLTQLYLFGTVLGVPTFSGDSSTEHDMDKAKPDVEISLKDLGSSKLYLPDAGAKIAGSRETSQ